MERINNMTLKEKFEEFKSGISMHSLLGTLYAIVVFIPAVMYLQLMTGQTGISVGWFTVVLFVEFMKLTGARLSKQEALLIYLIAGAEMFIPLTIAYRAYFRTSPVTKLFGLTDVLPDWWTPPLSSPVHTIRTVFHPDWLIPMVVFFASVIASSLLNFALGYIAREIYIEVEDLPFPLQQVDAEAIVTLTGFEERPYQIFSVFALIGLIYGSVLYAVPFIGQAWTGAKIQLLPVPWFDWTLQIQPSLPGAIWGLATDITAFAWAFVIPFNVVLAMFIGSFSVYFFGNWLLQENWEKWGLPDTNPDIPGVQSWWFPGMNIQMSLLRSTMYFWAAPLIGFALSAGIGPILRHPDVLKRAFSFLRTKRTQARKTEPISFNLYITIPLVGSLLIFALMFVLLTPDFVRTNLIIVVIIMLIPFVSMLISGRMRGEAGIVYMPAGNLQNIMYYTSGYRGADIWFLPTPIGATGWPLSWFKLAQLTKTKSTSLVKAYWLLLPFAMLVGIAYMEMFWRIAPIPSGRYPGAQIFWPIDVSYTCLWIKGTELGIFKPMWILYSFLIGLVLFFIFDFLPIPFSFTGLAVGAGTAPPFALSYLIGGVIGKLIGLKRREWWEKHKLLVAAGLVVGESIAATIAVAISLIMNSLWILPI